jgi:hypothetical protein
MAQRDGSCEDKLSNLYSSSSIIRMMKSRMMRYAGHIAWVGKKRDACRILAGKPEGKRPLGRPRCTWVDNSKIDLREIGCDTELLGFIVRILIITRKRIKTTLLLKSGRWIKSETPVILCVIHHRQNPIESNRMWCYGLDWFGSG